MEGSLLIGAGGEGQRARYIPRPGVTSSFVLYDLHTL